MTVHSERDRNALGFFGGNTVRCLSAPSKSCVPLMMLNGWVRERCARELFSHSSIPSKGTVHFIFSSVSTLLNCPPTPRLRLPLIPRLPDASSSPPVRNLMSSPQIPVGGGVHQPAPGAVRRSRGAGNCLELVACPPTVTSIIVPTQLVMVARLCLYIRPNP